MNATETHRLPILAAGDEGFIRDFYQDLVALQNRSERPETIFNWSISSLDESAVIAAQKAICPFAVAVIHFRTDCETALETAVRIRKIDPCVNFVMLSESEDEFEKIKVRVPPANKILIIHKPFRPEEVLQYIATMGAMWQSQKELQRASSELLEVNSRLIENNDALSALARNLEGSRRESENRIIQRIRTLIIPVIQKLQQERGLKQFQTDLDLLIGYIESLTSDLASDLKMAAALSKTELQVASMIKNGMTSEEIAAHLNVSLFTVKTHRKNIRKKLDIQNSGVNLQSYLASGLKEA